MKTSLEPLIEKSLFASRWLLAPFYLGLIGALLVLLLTFLHELFMLMTNAMHLGRNEALVGALSLIDLSLMANLVIIIMISGYESFVSRIDIADHEDVPDWRSTVNFAKIKVKLLSSIVAISAIDLLEAFVNIEHMSETHLKWLVIVFSAFVFACVLLSVVERFEKTGKK